MAAKRVALLYGWPDFGQGRAGIRTNEIGGPSRACATTDQLSRASSQNSLSERLGWPTRILNHQIRVRDRTWAMVLQDAAVVDFTPVKLPRLELSECSNTVRTRGKTISY